MVFKQYTKYEVNGEFLFVCNFPTCIYCCFEYSDLLVHMSNKHKHKFKAFECKECRRKFTTDKQLSLHSLDHLIPPSKTSLHVCEICKRKLGSLASLSRHRTRMHLYRCTLCPRTFYFNSTRKHHMLHRHMSSPNIPNTHRPATFGSAEPETILGI